MSTQAVPGYKAKARVSFDGGSTYNPIGNLQNVELHFGVTDTDATDHDSGGHKEFVATLDEWDATADYLEIDSNAVQASVDSALLNKTTCQFQFDPVGTSVGLVRWTGNGYFSDFKVVGKNADLVVKNLKIRGSGALTKVTQ